MGLAVAIPSCNVAPLRASDPNGNAFVYANDSPQGDVDPTGLTTVCSKLWLCATCYNQRTHSTIEESGRIAQQKIIDAAFEACYNRLAPQAVAQGVDTAMEALGIKDVHAQPGTDLKAALPSNIIALLLRSGHTVEEVATISGSGTTAWRVKIKGNWELKVYFNKDGSYSASIGNLTNSVPHYLDAIQYMANKVTLAKTNANPYNSEEFGQFTVIDGISLNAISQYKSLCPGVFD